MKMVVAALVVLLGQARPFNGKDLLGWNFQGDEGKSAWKVGKAKVDPDDPARLIVDGEGTDLINTGKGVNLFTEIHHADCILEVEVLVPRGSNSGLYLMGEYELQILDSHGKEKVGPGDMGGIYGVAGPTRNASKPAGQWQKLEIDFRAPKFDRKGNKSHAAIFRRVVLNDVVILRDVEVTKPTPAGLGGKEIARGPLMIQGDHGPVAFRNLKITGAAR